MTEHLHFKPKLYDPLPSGIEHGPYPAAPPEIVKLYMDRHHDRPELEPGMSDEQKRADIESEWQYDQHSAAAEQAFNQGVIDNVHYNYMLDTVLRPWWIGSRNPDS